MKKISLIAATSVAIIITASFFACHSGDPAKAAGNQSDITTGKTDATYIKEGEHLVAIMGCNDCHSPKRMGANGPEIVPELMLSGYPADRPLVKFDSKLIREGFAMFYPDLTAACGPWGITFAANLTPDDTGIGHWTEEQFKTAITKGKYKGMEGGRQLLPPMPWVNYVNLTNEEIHAMFTYFKSIKPVKNAVPLPISPDKM